ncbi:MAG: hypothetical protein FH753_06305 [Firmicutes bacterium]|nr:hypothetical protein [Bacillota bacterium]
MLKKIDFLEIEKKEDAERVVDIYISELKKRINLDSFNIEDKYINDLEKLLMEWKFYDKKVIIYELLGDLYSEIGDTNKEYTYYLKSLENHFITNRNDSYIIINKITVSCIKTEKYNEAITFSNLIIPLSKDIPKEYKAKIHYNRALSYKKLEEYKKALKEINLAESYAYETDYVEMKKFLMLKANCYIKLHRYFDALETYRQVLWILEYMNNYDEKCAIYLNMVDIYKDKDDKEKILEYVNKVVILLPNISKESYYLKYIYLELGNIYRYLKNNNLTEKYYKKALEISPKDVNIISKLLDFYYEENNYKGAFTLSEDILNSKKKEVLNENRNFNKILSLYLENDYIKEAKDLLNKKLKGEY